MRTSIGESQVVDYEISNTRAHQAREIDVTPKQARFAEFYVELGNASEAYRKAYNATSMKPATVSRRAKDLMDNGKIRARISELQKQHRERHRVSVESLTADARRVYEMAIEEKQTSPAIQALTLIARLHGLLVDKREHAGQVQVAPTPVKNRIDVAAITREAERRDREYLSRVNAHAPTSNAGRPRIPVPPLPNPLRRTGSDCLSIAPSSEAPEKR